MKRVFKLTMNITLLVMFLSILALPTGFMGIMKYEENPVVLSAQDSKEYEPAIKSIDDPSADVPEDIRDVIMRLEREYYNANGDAKNQEIKNDIPNEEVKETKDLEELEENLIQPSETN